MNVKCVIGKLEDLKSRHHHVTVINLLDWAPPQKSNIQRTGNQK